MSQPAPILDRDVPCFACSYNLRGLPAVATGRCPECGAAIGASLDPQQLPVVLLRALWAGTALLALDALLISAVLTALWFVPSVSSLLFENRWAASTTLFLLADQVLWVAGVFRLTVSYERLAGGGWWRSRRVPRWLAAVTAGVAAVMAFSFYGHAWRSPSARYWEYWMLQLLPLYFGLRALTVPFVTARIVNLARLVHRPWWRHQVRRVGRCSALVLVLATVAAFGVRGYFEYFMLLLILLPLLSLGLSLWAVVLLLRFERRVGELLRQARLGSAAPGA